MPGVCGLQARHWGSDRCDCAAGACWAGGGMGVLDFLTHVNESVRRGGEVGCGFGREM